MGTILKVVCIPRGSWHDLEEVLLEEMTVFRVGSSHFTCITSASDKPSLIHRFYCHIGFSDRNPPPLERWSFQLNRYLFCFNLRGCNTTWVDEIKLRGRPLVS